MLANRLFSQLLVSVVATLIALPAYADHSWGNYHWARSNNPLPLQMVGSVTSSWETEFNNSISDWDSSTVLALWLINGDTGSRLRKRCPMIPGQIRVCNASYGGAWLGLATIGIDSNGHIDQGTAQVNDFFSNYWDNKPEEKNHVMCQEIGHLFGLGHTSEDGSSQGTCMDYSDSSMFLKSQFPNDHDYEMLEDIYAHPDTYNGYDDGTGGGDTGEEEPCNAPPGKGCNKFSGSGPTNPMGFLIHRSEHYEIWVAPRDGGGLWIRHIRLAPKEYRTP